MARVKAALIVVRAWTGIICATLAASCLWPVLQPQMGTAEMFPSDVSSRLTFLALGLTGVVHIGATFLELAWKEVRA